MHVPAQRRRWALLVVAVLCAGCGPATILQVNVQSLRQDVKFGSPTESPQPVVLPAKAASLEPGSPPFLSAPIPFQPVRATPSLPSPPPPPPPPPIRLAPACPSAASRTPDYTATPDTRTAPAAGTYVYRQEGQWRVGEAVSNLPTQVVRSVGPSFVPPPPAVAPVPLPVPPTSPPSPTSALVEWPVEELSTDAHGWLTDTTTTYGLFTGKSPQDPTGPATMQYGRLAITEINTTYASGPNANTADDFIPSTPLTLIQFPAAEGASWTSAAADRNASHLGVREMTLAGSIGTKSAAHPDEGKVTVNACGKVVEGWRVNLDSTLSGEYGSVGSPCYQLTGYYTVATELGLVVQEFLGLIGGVSTANGCDTSGKPFDSLRLTTINSATP